jgi:hypothetical protein
VIVIVKQDHENWIYCVIDELNSIERTYKIVDWYTYLDSKV